MSSRSLRRKWSTIYNLSKPGLFSLTQAPCLPDGYISMLFHFSHLVGIVQMHSRKHDKYQTIRANNKQRSELAAPYFPQHRTRYTLYKYARSLSTRKALCKSPPKVWRLPWKQLVGRRLFSLRAKMHEGRKIGWMGLSSYTCRARTRVRWP